MYQRSEACTPNVCQICYRRAEIPPATANGRSCPLGSVPCGYPE
jgi:hypothetical protein